MRILLIGPGVNRKYGDKFYYSTARRIANGFIRNGHFVMHVSDRDLSDYALGWRAVGKYYACHRINQIARGIKPDLVVLLLADLMTAQAVSDLRKAVPGVKVVAVELDPIANANVAKRFSDRLDHCDAGYVTTGGSVLAAVAKGRAAFHIPNIVDTAIDDQLAYENTAINYDVFFAGSQNKDSPQWSRALALQAMSPHRTHCYAGAGKTGGLWGYDFIQAQGRSRVGLNLNRVEGDLYASDRMGQYLGNGLLLATDRVSGYDRFFGEDEMIFFSTVEDLDAQLTRDLATDVWREKARKARATALRTMSNTVVCRFIESTARHDKPSPDWVF